MEKSTQSTTSEKSEICYPYRAGNYTFLVDEEGFGVLENVGKYNATVFIKCIFHKNIPSVTDWLVLDEYGNALVPASPINHTTLVDFMEQMEMKGGVLN